MNIHITELLYNFVFFTVVTVVVTWILGKLRWGMEIDGFVPVLLSGLLTGALNFGLPILLQMLLKLRSMDLYGWWILVTTLGIPIISVLISVFAIKGVRFKSFLGVLLICIGIIVMALLTIVVGSLLESAIR